MWKRKTKWLVSGGRKVRCYLCGKKILAKGDLFLFHGDTGYYSHQSCMTESTTISGNERRRAVKKIAVGAAVVGAIAAGAGKFLDVSSQSKNSPTAQTILTSQGLIPPALTSDPANPVPGQMWYRSDAGVMAHFDAVQNRVVYSSEINDGNVNVTPKGIVNGLSVLPNDGKGGFGPDTTKGATAPGQYGGTYTETVGIMEAWNYAVSSNIETIELSPGTYTVTSQILTYNYSNNGVESLNYNILSLHGNNAVIQLNLSSVLSSNPDLFYLQPSKSYSKVEIDGLIFDYSIQSTSVVLGLFGSRLTTGAVVDIHDNFILGSTSVGSNGLIYTASPFETISSYSDTAAYQHIHNNVLVNCKGDIADIGGANTEINHNVFWNCIDSQVATNYNVQNLSIHDNLWYYTSSTAPPSGTTPISFSFQEKDSLQTIISVHDNIAYGTNGFIRIFDDNSGLTGNVLSHVRIENNEYYAYDNDSSTYPFINENDTTASIEDLVYNHNLGYSPAPTTPSVPSSGTAQENTNPYAVDVYVYGGDVTEIQITKGGTAYTVFSVSTAIAMSGQAYKLNSGDSITVTYSTAPTWEWLSD